MDQATQFLEITDIDGLRIEKDACIKLACELNRQGKTDTAIMLLNHYIEIVDLDIGVGMKL